MTPRKPFFAWPSTPHLRHSAAVFAVTMLCFGVVYGGCNWITGLHTYRLRIDFAWEQDIPFVPWMTFFYMSIYFMFLLAPFVLRERGEMRAAGIAMCGIIGVAGIFFLATPATLAYPPPPSAGAWQGMFDLADRINLDNNLAPSLHVGLSSLTALILGAYARWPGKLLLGSWAIAISASTMMTHQHHFVDVVTGHALAAAGYWWIYLPVLAGRFAAAQTGEPAPVPSVSGRSA